MHRTLTTVDNEICILPVTEKRLRAAAEKPKAVLFRYDELCKSEARLCREKRTDRRTPLESGE